jgi:hypothetical protein
MRYPDAVTFPGLIMWAGDTRGPIAPQGTYTVRMRVGSSVQTQTFNLMNDPRTKATAADQLAQFNFLIKVRDRVSEANEAVISMRYVKSQMDDRLKSAPTAAKQELTSVGGPLKTNLTSVESEVYQIKNQSGQDPLNFPIKLNNKIAALTGSVGSAPGRVTVQARAVFEELNIQLDKQTHAMKKLYAEDLKKYNELLKKYGMPEIKTKPEKSTPNVTADFDDAGLVRW